MVDKYILEGFLFVCLTTNKIFSLRGEIYRKDRLWLDKLTRLQKIKFFLLSVKTQQMSLKSPFIQKQKGMVG